MQSKKVKNQLLALFSYLGIEKIIEHKNRRRRSPKKNNSDRRWKQIWGRIKYAMGKKYYKFSWTGLKLGLKPVTLIEQNQGDTGAVVDYVKKNNYHFVCQKYHTKDFLEEVKTPPKEFNNLVKIFISKNRNLATEAKICNNRIHLERKYTPQQTIGFLQKMGALLGYPSCCISNYIFYSLKVKKFTSLSESETFFRQVSLLNSYRKLNVYLNNFFFPDLLYSHYPCSYNCKNSIRIAKKTYAYIVKKNKQLADAIKIVNSTPFLFFQYPYFIVFPNSFFKKKRLFYNIASPLLYGFEDGDLEYKHWDSLSKNLLLIFNKGNNLEVNDKYIQIYYNEEPIYILVKKDKFSGILLNFIE